jgi:hypothetical protein
VGAHSAEKKPFRRGPVAGKNQLQTLPFEAGGKGFKVARPVAFLDVHGSHASLDAKSLTPHRKFVADMVARAASLLACRPDPQLR